MEALGRFSEGEPQRYSVEAVAPDVDFYRDATIGPERKCLIVCFCGASNRLMMPISCLLQYLPSDFCDVIVLRDKTRQHYFKGITGYAESLPALVRRIADDLGADAYLRRYCFGVSMGAFPALRAGVLMEADRAVSVGGGFALHPRRLLEEPDIAPPAFDPICGCVGNADTELVCAYAAGDKTDRQSATHLSHIRAVTLISVPDLTEHNIIKKLAKKGLLRDFFNGMFALSDALESAGAMRSFRR